ncbi:MAG TPA: Smr/MutS family protein [Anaerolineae bacterium]|nr:Smr/MutS family protein [Anaerolineae bacterium]
MDLKALRLLEFHKVCERLAAFTGFALGRRLALALEPSTDAAVVRERQALTAEARDLVARRGGPDLSGAHDLRPQIESACLGRVLVPAELLELRDTVAVARRLERTIGRDDTRWPRLAAIARRLEPSPALHDAIQEALDDDGKVRDEASPALRRIRKELRVAAERLRRQLEGMLGSEALRGVLQDGLITQRNGRYVIPVKADFRGRVPGVVHDTSDSGATLFVEPLAAVESGNRLRELQLDEEKEIDRILRELSGRVAAEAQPLGDSIEALGDLDLVFAAAQYASVLRAVAPHILPAGEPQLDFPLARHPLLDPETVVPVSVRVGRDFSQMVITGPNTGGKTVTLKTAGLLVLMAQAGLQVPADEEACLTVFDAVYADIGDEQSIEQSLSTFSGHMTNLVGILQRADAGSLLLLDELGAGTDPTEGAALAGAILSHLLRRGVRTIASTHYSELKAYGHGTPGVANASVEFDAVTLRPTYRLTIGLPGRSNALAIAGRLGLPEAILQEARAGLQVSDVAMEDLLAQIQSTRREVEAERLAAAQARERSEAWAVKLERSLHHLEAERTEIINGARQEAQAELGAAREAVATLLRRAEKAQEGLRGRGTPAQPAAPAEPAPAEPTAGDAVADLKAAMGQLDALRGIVERTLPKPKRQDLGARPLGPGDVVRVVSLGQTGEVIKVAGSQVELQLGRMRMTVDAADLDRLPQAQPALESDARLLRATGSRATVPLQLDLRGMRVEEGLEAVDSYLHEAMLSGMPFVRIIHGHGTGAMKTAVREALRRSSIVHRSRPGQQNEGGDGATVVYFEAESEG